MTQLNQYANFFVFRSPILFFLSICYSIIFIDIISIILIYFSELGLEEQIFIYNILSADWYILLFILFLHITFLVSLYIKWRFDYYFVEKWHIIHKKWIILRRIEQLNIQNINGITVKQSFFWRIFNYGNININFNGWIFLIKFISDPQNFWESLIRYIQSSDTNSNEE